jgi:2-methylisocitrate lyase-like PEP mutase family enzyme
MRATSKLRKLLSRDGLVIAGGVNDALGAKIIEEAGYEAIYVSG